MGTAQITNGLKIFDVYLIDTWSTYHDFAPDVSVVGSDKGVGAYHPDPRSSTPLLHMDDDDVNERGYGPCLVHEFIGAYALAMPHEPF